MKYVFLLLILLVLVPQLKAQGASAQDLDRKMTEIRENTNWDDPAAAKKANEEIAKLAKQLKILKQTKGMSKDNPAKAIKEKNEEYNAGVLNQMMKAFREGKEADLLLGEPLREEIIEDYKEDESPKNITPEFMQEMTVMIIDMSLPTVQRTIDMMDKYKSIKTLIITSGDHPVAVNLQDLLKKAAKYPLESLYIINFGLFVSKIPDQIFQYKNLSVLGMFNNKISQFPANVNSFSKLDSLYIDQNPIATLMPAINSMKKLKKLGIVKTSITDSEIKKIQQILPGCEVLTNEN